MLRIGVLSVPDEPVKQSWRYIQSGHLSGSLNMAIDTVLATQIDTSTPTLRLYGWSPPAISLGYHQPISEIDLSKCTKAGIDVVHRPTGGRAVLHAEEITYAVVIPKSSPYYSEKIMTVYEQISRAILAGLRYLDIRTEFEHAKKNSGNYSRGDFSSLCYATSIQYEINYQGKKLVGSAQRHFDAAVLQHGSILIGPRHADLPFYLTKGNAEWKNAVKAFMQKQTTCLNHLSPEPLSYERVADALLQGFQDIFNATFHKTELSEQEWNLAKKLNKTKN
jgi:lipoate-protein ligase A